MDNMTPIYDALGWPSKLRPTTHTLVTNKQDGHITAECACGDWAGESCGTDESSMRAISSGFTAHAIGRINP